MKTQIKEIQIEVKDYVVNVKATHEYEVPRFNLVDFAKGVGVEGRDVSDRIHKWIESEETAMNKGLPVDSETRRISVFTKRGKNGGTFATQHQLYSFAGYLHWDFKQAVYNAFENLTNGNTKEAENISKRVAKVRKAQLQDRPRGTIQELYEDSDERSIAEWVHGLLFEDCSNNTAAEIEHRMRFAKSTRDFILSDKCVSRLKVKNGHSSDKDSALLVVAEYMFARKTQYLSLQNTLKDKKLSDIRERSLKIGNIAKRLREEKNMIQAERDIAYIQIDNLNNEIEMIQIETEFLSREIKRVKEEIPF